MAEESAKPVRRTRTAEAADAVSEGFDRVARWTPQQAMTVVTVVLLTFLCAGFAGQLWISQEQSKARDRETREALAAYMREANARDELARIHCAAEAAKVRAESAETVKSVLAAAMAEGERGRTWQAAENEKFRREMAAAIKAKP